jgi:RNA polymerase sigma-70 factor, ECF subfamily
MNNVFAAGEPAASPSFEVVYDAYYPRIYNYILHLIGGSQRYTQLAEDLTQECFLKAFKAFYIHEHTHVSAWLYRIATNTIYDYLRKQRLIKWYSIDIPAEEEESSNNTWIPLLTATSEEEDDPQQRYDGAREALESALAKLPKKYRVPLLMHEEGYEYSEIAQTLHISSSALKMRMMRARNQLGQLYSEGEREEAARV